MQKVTRELQEHYRKTFLKFGATTPGVDWGTVPYKADIRQHKMLGVLRGVSGCSLLDVGCGYGHLASVIKEKSLEVSYSGVDVVNEMVCHARSAHPDCNFWCGDFLEMEFDKFDFLVSNGILTQKLGATVRQMDAFSNSLISKMFDLSRIGVAFNLMSTHVNFFASNLYYRNPAEVLGWCMSQLTPHVVVDSSYELPYEYTVYLYKEEFIRTLDAQRT